MPTSVKREESEYKYPDDEYYPSVLSRVEEVEVPYFKKDEAGVKTTEQAIFRKWEWYFKVVSGPFEGDTLRGDTPPEMTTREDNKVRIWGEALLGREIEVGEEFDTDQIVGLPCLISVRHEKPRDRPDGTKFYGSVVDEVMPRTGTLQDEEPPF